MKSQTGIILIHFWKSKEYILCKMWWMMMRHTKTVSPDPLLTLNDTELCPTVQSVCVCVCCLFASHRVRKHTKPPPHHCPEVSPLNSTTAPSASPNLSAIRTVIDFMLLYCYSFIYSAFTCFILNIQ